MLGRTHGQAAVPITFGLKAAVWLDEMRRQLIRLDEASPRVAVGKFLGAVGTAAAQGEHARELQRLIMTHLGLGVPLATTQVVGRDRYVEYMSWLANVATTCEKVLQEIRNLYLTPNPWKQSNLQCKPLLAKTVEQLPSTGIELCIDQF